MLNFFGGDIPKTIVLSLPKYASGSTVAAIAKVGCRMLANGETRGGPGTSR